MRHFLKSLIGIVAVLVISCDSPDETGLIDIGKDYFPMKKGLYQVYDIDEINYALGVPETLEYELKTHVVDSFLALDGEYRYVIHRSKRDSGTDDWTYLDTWSAQVNNHEAVMSEENTSFLKLVFPVAKGVEWDGNKYNTGDPDDYALEEVETAYTVNDNSFGDCIKVVQADDPDPIVFFDVRSEIYARSVGLIQRESTQLQYCDDPDCLGQQEVESGIIYIQTIKSYGME